jgi:hypothetical protein
MCKAQWHTGVSKPKSIPQAQETKTKLQNEVIWNMNQVFMLALVI